jgi:pimeloyl-ACP methyl ester carboxylesterase
MKTLVMIPGMMCDERLFKSQFAALSDDLNIHVPVPKGHDEISAFANDILENVSGQFSLLGLSMGGIIAMEILRQAKERVERVALFDTNPLAEKEDVKLRRIQQIEAVKNGKLIDIMRDEMKPNYLADGPLKKEILDLCMDMATDLGPEVFIDQSIALMNRPDQTEVLKSTDIPALILCGREDTLCPIERHELMYDLMPDAEFVVIDGAGHMPVLEQSEITNIKIKTWLEK